MENAERAIMMTFAVIILVFALGIAISMFSKVLVTAEHLSFYADSTIYYDNVKLDDDSVELNDPYIKDGTVRIVNAETIIPTLYRYYKENFCVKIYDATNQLIQVFDVNLEGKVHGAAGDTYATANAKTPVHIENNAYNKVYNDKSKKYCLFGAPWLGSTESVKKRVDYFIDGKAGYINNTYVDYKSDKYNDFYEARVAGMQFKERFICYSYTGQTMTTEGGDQLITGEKSKDKIVIIYTLINNDD